MPITSTAVSAAATMDLIPGVYLHSVRSKGKGQKSKSSILLVSFCASEDKHAASAWCGGFVRWVVRRGGDCATSLRSTGSGKRRGSDSRSGGGWQFSRGRGFYPPAALGVRVPGSPEA